MKLVQQFDSFLSEIVNLNATRVGQLEDSIEALKDVVRASDWGPKIQSFVPQGSWALKTIIKPVEQNAFDADLLVFVEPKDGWDATTYLDTLYEVFTNHGVYKEKVRRYSHCITIEYAGERKIDIAPCLVDRGGVTRLEVCNRDTNDFERSEPRRYTDWLIERNGWTGGNGLRKTTRLLKFLRDIKTTFSCSSVLLTTLLGARISSADESDTDRFSDTPTALKTIVGRLDDWLQANENTPTVANPVLASEVLSGAWDDVRYANFRTKIHTYRAWIDDAYGETDRDESIGKWRRVFGEDFAKNVAIEKAAAVSAEALALMKSTASTPTDVDGDLVTLFARYGVKALPPGFDHLPHKQRPRWRTGPTPLFAVGVSTTLHEVRDGDVIHTVTVVSSPLPKHHWLHFEPRVPTGITLAGDYGLFWRVTNTDKAAQAAGCLRGEILPANDGISHWERLEYRGVHTIEAFVIRNRDDVLVAQSPPFYVVIE